MKYKLVIFDFDGTLANSLPWFMGVTNTFADKYRFKRIEEHEVDTLRGYSARQIVQHLGVPMWKVPVIARHMRRVSAEQIDQVSLFPGVDRMLQQLAEAGISLAIVTSNSYDNVRHVLGPNNAALIRYFEGGVSLFGKRARFRNVLKQSGVQPHEAMSIGDEIRDIEASHKEQIPFGAVSWGFTHVEALKALGPTAVFATVEDIVATCT